MYIKFKYTKNNKLRKTKNIRKRKTHKSKKRITNSVGGMGHLNVVFVENKLAERCLHLTDVLHLFSFTTPILFRNFIIKLLDL